MKRILFLFLFATFIYANEENKTYKKALELEKQGEYKKAMLLYKQAFNEKIKKEESFTQRIKNSTYEASTYAKLKKDFYQKNIQKSEDKEANESIEQIVTSDFGLFPYKKNYLLPITYDTKERENREQIETKFQFSVEKPLTYNLFGLNETISFGYTQKSYWQTAKDSSPFRETNYQPEIFMQIPYKNSDTFKGYKISLIHESNGRDNENSRSWNRIYAEGYLQYSKLFVVPRVWYRIPEESKNDDNEDIYKYYGYGDLRLVYPYKKHLFELTLRNNLRLNSQNKGSAQLDWTFPLPSIFSSPNTYGFVQVFSGYGDSLIDYDEEVNRIGFGIALSR